MATNPVNLIDVIGVVAPRYARARSAVVRVGVISGAPYKSGAQAFVNVTVGGGTFPAAYHIGYAPTNGDVVTVLNDGDKWIVLGRQAKASDLP